MRTRPAATTFLIASLLGCSGIAQVWRSLTWPTSAPGEIANLVIREDLAYATLGADGIAVFDVPSGRPIVQVPPPPGLGSVDDLAFADGLLFALDARPPGHLATLTLRDPRAPAPTGAVVAVPVGPFSGVAAGGGRVVVSGGTSELTARRYGSDGELAAEAATADLGRGQPDVSLAPDGSVAFVSTHFEGIHFGLTTLLLDSVAGGGLRAGEPLHLEGAGFTPGGARPANFPIVTALSSAGLVVAHGGGVALVDVSDRLRPRLRASLALEVAPVHVAVEGDRAVVVGSSPRPRLVELDLRAPEGPRALRAWALPESSFPVAVACAPRHYVVAGQTGGLIRIER